MAVTGYGISKIQLLPRTTCLSYLIEKVTLKLILTTLPDWFFCEEEVSVTLEEFVLAVLSLLVSLCHKKKYEKIKKLLIYEWLDQSGNYFWIYAIQKKVSLQISEW